MRICIQGNSRQKGKYKILPSDTSRNHITLIQTPLFPNSAPALVSSNTDAPPSTYLLTPDLALPLVNSCTGLPIGLPPILFVHPKYFHLSNLANSQIWPLNGWSPILWLKRSISPSCCQSHYSHLLYTPLPDPRFNSNHHRTFCSYTNSCCRARPPAYTLPQPWMAISTLPTW